VHQNRDKNDDTQVALFLAGVLGLRKVPKIGKLRAHTLSPFKEKYMGEMKDKKARC